MTIIIGIKCADGIVLGADSLATYSTGLGGQPTIKQQTSKKLHIIGEQIVLGVAGPVGLGQSYYNAIEAIVKQKQNQRLWTSIAQARGALRGALWPYAKEAWEAAAVVAQTVGPQAAHGEANHASLVAYIVGDTPY